MAPSSSELKKQLAQNLRIQPDDLNLINRVLGDPSQRVINDFLDVVLKYGTPQEINEKAGQASQMDVLIAKVRERHPEYLVDLNWLRTQRDAGTFITMAGYRQKILGPRADEISFDEERAIELEISACQYFPWLIQIARTAINHKEVMPSRYVRIRNMKEQEADGDLPAFAAAMQIMGTSYVEFLDTRGSDDVYLEQGGIGQPNQNALKWLDEYLYYYTAYGVRQVLDLNPGTILLGYFLHRLGVDIEFKISVPMGMDNPYSALWALLTASLFARPDDSTPLVGFNWSNVVENETIEISAQFRETLNLESLVRFEHHVTEPWNGWVRQPYNRRDDVVDLAGKIANLAAVHEGGEPEVEQQRKRPSDVADYSRDKDEIFGSPDWQHLALNFMDKYDALVKTAHALTLKGLAIKTATKLHS